MNEQDYFDAGFDGSSSNDPNVLLETQVAFQVQPWQLSSMVAWRWLVGGSLVLGLLVLVMMGETVEANPDKYLHYAALWIGISLQWLYLIINPFDPTPMPRRPFTRFLSILQWIAISIGIWCVCFILSHAESGKKLSQAQMGVIIGWVLFSWTYQMTTGWNLGYAIAGGNLGKYFNP